LRALVQVETPARPAVWSADQRLLRE
jgi:hypothetical protein